MPDPGAVLASLAVALLVVVMLWFALGTQRNIRRGNARLEWLQAALPELGQRTNLRWLGSSVVQLDLVDPTPPFRDVAILYVLEPRDIPLLWLFARRTGRRDVLIVRASLRRAPRLDLEVVSPAAWIRAADADDAAGWPAVAFPSDIIATAIPGADPDGVAAARHAWDGLAAATDQVWRVSIRRTVPHLEIHVRPSAPERAAADRVIRPIIELAMELGRN